MPSQSSHEPPLFDKIRALPPERLAEVEDFVEFLLQKDEERRLRQAVTTLSEAAFAKVWDNPDDDAYNAL